MALLDINGCAQSPTIEELRWRGEPDQEFCVGEEPAKLHLAEAAAGNAVGGLWEIDPAAAVEVGTESSRPELSRPTPLFQLTLVLLL
uniref:Uncharacterized protein n=1 Tax=Sphaerodactylus townsendi TaxID=933632 RepID=A0ACB8GAG3_9SAUR